MKKESVICYLGIGSNLGDKEYYCREAVRRIGAVSSTYFWKKSSIYKTEPACLKDVPWFLNSVIGIKTTLVPVELLNNCQRIERELGRIRSYKDRYESRTIDIDILFYNDMIVNENDLTIPHPLLHKRRFVLAPLAEIAPDYLHPTLKKTIMELYKELDDKHKIIKEG
ncbi:MAG: 2-amino-4-hydroxy-6-hydroxymethyldihydropteridine diphosphokinase [Nitrospirota bacterium]